MNNVSSIIEQILQMFGIQQAPQTASELMWDILIIVVGLYIVKYCMIFILALMKEMLKLRG